MKEVRAIVLGLFVVVLVAVGLAFWRRPAKEFRRIQGYRVEIQKSEGGLRRHVTFRVPISLVARIVSLAPMSDISGDGKADWGSGEITARDILEAAGKSAPGQPGVIVHDHDRIEVTADGMALSIVVKDAWDKTVRVRVPRALIESLSEEKRISARDILRRLDELGPGDVVVIRDGNQEVTITAEGR
ncbi:MAG TPA: hypothetical protein VLO07_01555 [Thermoanaerobaculia bacterium]|nr:hypothetical protein [Thermoanaerobaculia bacterium]